MTGVGAGQLTWRTGATVQLAAGYTLADAEGGQVGTVIDVDVAMEGGFLHVAQPGGAFVQVVSAPAVQRITYQRE
jgi:hypothetical protein